jgi:hypothetical protein
MGTVVMQYLFCFETFPGVKKSKKSATWQFGKTQNINS